MLREEVVVGAVPHELEEGVALEKEIPLKMDARCGLHEIRTSFERTFKVKCAEGAEAENDEGNVGRGVEAGELGLRLRRG